MHFLLPSLPEPGLLALALSEMNIPIVIQVLVLVGALFMANKMLAS